MSIFNRLTHPLCLTKARKIEKHARPYLNRKVLDLGAGRCLVAQRIQQANKAKDVQVTCADVVDVNQTEMPLVLYDGKKLPFRNKEFDTVLLVYVLHHCNDPAAVLKEAARVCKGNIIVFEDTKISAFEEIVDTIVNKLNHGDINTPHNFMSEDEWAKLFKRMGLETVAKQTGVEKQWFYPFALHTMFVLRKSRRR